MTTGSSGKTSSEKLRQTNRVTPSQGRGLQPLYKRKRNDEMEITINTQIKLDTVDLWEAIWGSDGSGIVYWCPVIRDENGEGVSLWVEDENGDLKGNPQTLKMLDVEDNWHVVTVDQMVKGYELARQQGLTHCGSYPLDHEDSDSCFGDVVLQLAIFGEMVYG